MTETEDYEYARDEIVPLPAKCGKCGRNWVGRDAIRAPSLRQCRCFYCGGKLLPHPLHPGVVDAETRRAMAQFGPLFTPELVADAQPATEGGGK